MFIIINYVRNKYSYNRNKQSISSEGMKVRTTYFAKKEDVNRRWYVIDAEGIPLGRLSSVIASILRGKNKPTYTPNVDTGDSITVINAGKVKLTGRKATDKIYYHHTLHPGGLKQKTAGEMREKTPEKLIEKSVKGMLPHNSLGRKIGLKLHVYAGSDHNNQAQNPEILDIKNLI